VRRCLRTLVAATALVALWASPAAADAAGPTGYRSRVTGIEPSVPFLSARIIGGDAFLELRVDAGHEVVVAGYEGEPYIRFGDDGTVERNRRSPATYLNDDRRGEVTLPADADADAEPDWEGVADDGVYAWHDHRVHVMPGFNTDRFDDQRTLPWLDAVDITADGQPVQITGTITRVGAPPTWLWAALALVVAAALVLAPPAATPLALTGAAVLAIVAGRAELAASPADAGGNDLLLALPALAAAAAVAAAALSRRTQPRLVLGLAAVALLSSWALLRIDTVLEPVLPSDLPDWVDRLSVSLALGTSLAAAYALIVRSSPGDAGTGTAG
jgi:hypothetical protein